MAVNLSPVGGVAAQFFTNTGAVLTGGKIYTYAAGTTTPATTYTSSQGNTAHANPIVLDAAGRVPGGEIWLTDGINYKFVLKDSTDVLIATYDNISGINSNFVAFVNQQEIITATAGQTVFNLTISFQPGTNSLSVFVDGVNQYGPGAQYAYTETDSDTVTFVSGLHVGAEVKFTTTQQQSAGAIDSSQVTYDPPFTGSVATNVEAKLAQTVSVMDFGAVGDGAADDTSAIQTALNTGKTVYFPDGTYKITSPLTVSSTTRKIYGNGPKTVIYPYLTAGDTCFDVTVQAVRFEFDNFYFNLPSGEDDDIAAIAFTSATPANRGNVISNIWINGLQKGFVSTAGSFAKLSIENWHHHYLSANVAGSHSIKIDSVANTVFLSNLDIIGGFERGVWLAGSVFDISDFNIAGDSPSYLMGTSVYLDTCSSGAVQNGWVEGLVDPGNPGDQPAIHLIDCTAVSIRNVNVANGSVYFDNGIGNTLEACMFGNTTGGVRTVGFPEFSVFANNQLVQGGDAIAWFDTETFGQITVIGYTNQQPKRGYLAQSSSVMTTAPTRTNAGLVTLTANTTDYLLGTQSQLVTTTAANQGVQFAFTGLLASTLYTFTCFVKSTASSDKTTLSVVTGAASGSYPKVTANVQTTWNKLSLPALSDVSGNLTLKVTDSQIGSFKIDCAQLWLGYRLDEPEQTLP
jgi:hypothetical protein